MRRRFAAFILILVATGVVEVRAHEVRPAYLQLHQTGADTYDVFWKSRRWAIRCGLVCGFNYPQTARISKPRATSGKSWAVWACTGRCEMRMSSVGPRTRWTRVSSQLLARRLQ